MSMKGVHLAILLSLIIGLTVLLLSSNTTHAQSGQRCFPETGHCIAGRIREFWDRNGGIAVFGLPVTAQRSEQLEGQVRQVQWFERARLELHPENPKPYDVLLGRLGVERLQQQQRDWFDFPRSNPQPGCRYFPETGHNVCAEILATWRSRGIELDGRPGKTGAESLALFGLPLSDIQVEIIEGKPYRVQWFERARFELHPENAPPYNVLLGRLGSEMLGGQIGVPQPASSPEVEVQDIVSLMEQGKVAIEARGQSIDRVVLRLRRQAPQKLQVRIPLGALFEPGRADAQRMVAVSERTVTLTHDEWVQIEIPVACANIQLNIPESTDTFTIRRSSDQEDLQRLLAALDQANAGFAVRQAAIWIVTDDASYDDLGTLVWVPSNTRVIQHVEAARAMQLCEMAGINIAQKRIWNDRYTILDGLPPGELRQWLALK